MDMNTTLKIIVATTFVLLLAVQPSLARDFRGHNPGQSAQDQIEDLPVCYAYGTDALGSAVNATGGQPLDSTLNLDDPQFAEGLAFYRKCFAKGFSFTLQFGGVTLLTVPDPETRTEDTDAALEWANFVNNAFREPGYINTQHHMGSISSSSQGNTGNAKAYLIATHSYGPNSSLTGVQVVGGTYTDDVIREKGTWLIETRTLNITSNIHTPADL